MNILLWHVHAAWATAFVAGGHTYLIPALPGRGPDGRGRPRTYPWPATAREVTPEHLSRAGIDLVVLQRPEEFALTREWTGRRPGIDIPAVYVEHNTPRGNVPDTPHVLTTTDVADGIAPDGLTLVHVTHFNRLMYDNGRLPTRVIEHGIPDPGYLYSGEIPRAAVAVNEPVRRWRVAGTDLLARFATVTGLDVCGIAADELPASLPIDAGRLRILGDLPQAAMHEAFARRRMYLHPFRWTSLGLALLEAMHLGMPVVGLATTEAVEAVPRQAGVLSNDVDVLLAAAAEYIADPEAARTAGKAAREAALERYGLARFLADWDRLIGEVVTTHRRA